MQPLTNSFNPISPVRELPASQERSPSQIRYSLQETPPKLRNPSEGIPTEIKQVTPKKVSSSRLLWIPSKSTSTPSTSDDVNNKLLVISILLKRSPQTQPLIKLTSKEGSVLQGRVFQLSDSATTRILFMETDLYPITKVNTGSIATIDFLKDKTLSQ